MFCLDPYALDAPDTETLTEDEIYVIEEVVRVERLQPPFNVWRAAPTTSEEADAAW